MRQPQQQTAVVVAGAPGAGKSTVALALARELRAALIDIDASFGAVVPLLEPCARAVVREAVYEGLTTAAATAAAAGPHVVIAAPFTRERREPEAWAALCDRLSAAGAAAVLVWVRVPEATLLERLAARGAGRDAAKLAAPATWLRDAAPADAPAVPHVEVDGTLPPDAAARRVLEALR